MKNTFVMYDAWRPMIMEMSDEQAGQILKPVQGKGQPYR